jgi:hypothetical protein
MEAEAKKEMEADIKAAETIDKATAKAAADQAKKMAGKKPAALS